MNIGHLSPDAEPIGIMKLNGNPIELYEENGDLPDSPKKREVCRSHHAEGRVDEMMNDFIPAGAHFPESNEPQVIRTQFSCKGVSCILKKCGLTLTQYDAEGNVLTVGKFTDSK